MAEDLHGDDGVFFAPQDKEWLVGEGVDFLFDIVVELPGGMVRREWQVVDEIGQDGLAVFLLVGCQVAFPHDGREVLGVFAVQCLAEEFLAARQELSEEG